MKKGAGDITLLCVNFCTYYKPGKEEGLACQGFKVVRRLLEEGRPLSLAKRGITRGRAETANVLRAKICTNCSFSEADCDFLLTGGKALPCGGFAFLHRLLDAGEITVEKIEEAMVPS